METSTTARVATEAVWAVLHDRLFHYIRRRVATDQDAKDILSEGVDGLVALPKIGKATAKKIVDALEG